MQWRIRARAVRVGFAAWWGAGWRAETASARVRQRRPPPRRCRIVAQHTSVPRARPRTRRVAVEPGTIGVRSRFSSRDSLAILGSDLDLIDDSKIENRDLTPDGVSRRERATGARFAIASIAMSPL